MDALEALGQHRLDAEQERAFRGPVSRRSGSVFLAGDHQERHAVGLVPHRRVVDRHHLALRKERRPSAFRSRRQLIAQPDVRERAAHHDFVIAAARAVRIEIRRARRPLQSGICPPGCRPGSTRRARCDRSSRCRRAPRAHARCGCRPAVRARASGARRTAGCECKSSHRTSRSARRSAPAATASGRRRRRRGSTVAEHLRSDRTQHRLLDLALRRPDVPEVHRRALRILAERLGGQIDLHLAGERIGDNKRRRRQIVGADLRLNAPLEVAVAAQHRGDHEIRVLDDLRHRLGQRPAVADARRAAVADDVEAELGEVLEQARPP